MCRFRESEQTRQDRLVTSNDDRVRGGSMVRIPRRGDGEALALVCGGHTSVDRGIGGGCGWAPRVFLITTRPLSDPLLRALFIAPVVPPPPSPRLAPKRCGSAAGPVRWKRKLDCRHASAHAAPGPQRITSSTRKRRDDGTVSPSAWAVFRLMMSSKLVGCSTGKSAGLAPFRRRSM
jgi:hypothetical protein